MKAIRGGAGLGDAIYVHAVARHLKQPLRVHTHWPEVFRFLDVETAPFTRQGIDILAHYSLRKGAPGTTQFQDVCITAGVKDVELAIEWKATTGIADQLNGKRVLCVQLPRPPMGRTDGFGKELLPDCRVIQKLIERTDYYVVQIGAGEPLFRFDGIDLDLANKTTVSEMFDVVQASEACLGYPSFIVPLAEVFDKRLTVVWSRRGLKANEYVRRVTPEKVLHKPATFIFDDATERQIAEVIL